MSEAKNEPKVVYDGSDYADEGFYWVMGDKKLNVQIDPVVVTVGDWVHVAYKEEVQAGSHPKRLIAKYQPLQVKTPDKCYDRRDPDGKQHCTTICTECIDAWSWDYLVRFEARMIHGEIDCYLSFGCRCNECRYALRLHLIDLGMMTGKGTSHNGKYGPIQGI